MADPPRENGSGSRPPVRWARAAGDLLVALFAGALAAAAFAGSEPAPYLFPRILASLLLLLCAVQIANVLRGADESVNPPQLMAQFRRALPAVAVVITYIALAERLGFYLAAVPAFIAFVLVGSSGRTRRDLLQAALVALVFAAVLYGVFAKLLYVQTPRGILF